MVAQQTKATQSILIDKDPGLRANHGRFRGVLVPLPPEILAWIDEWGVCHLLRGSTIPPHLVDTALRIVSLIAWTRVPVESHILGPYYRYYPFTGEVDSVPRRRVVLDGGRNNRPSHRELMELPLVFRDGMTISDVPTVADLLAEHLRADPDVVTELADGYDSRCVDVAHIYRDHVPHFLRPYHDDAAIAIR